MVFGRYVSLVLQADKKDFGAIRRVFTILMEMTVNQNTIHLKSFNGQNEVLMGMNNCTDCNIYSTKRYSQEG